VKTITTMRTINLLLLITVLYLFQCKMKTPKDENQFSKNPEFISVENAINNVFSWAVKKDFDLFFHTIADDSNFISVTPYNRVKFGFNAVRKDSA